MSTPVDPAAHAKETLETQLGRFERLSARKAVKRFPAEVGPGERITVLGVGEIPRAGKQFATQNADFAVVAVTNLGVLVVSRLRVERLDREAITSFEAGATAMGGTLVLHQSDAEPLRLKAVLPVGRVDGIARAIAGLIHSTGPTTAPEPYEPPAPESAVASSHSVPGALRDPVEMTVLKARHRQRQAAWAAVIAARSEAEDARRDQLVELSRECEEALRGRKLASTGGWTDKIVLHEGNLEHKGISHGLTSAVRASIDQQGNTSTSQGWVMKTQQDSREIFVAISGDGWYVTVRAAKGSTAGTDAGAMMTNFEFRQKSKAARDFADAVNTAAAQSPNFFARARVKVERNAEKARTVRHDVAAIMAQIAAQKALLAEQRPQLEADLQAARDQAQEVRRGLSGRALRSLVADLETEVDALRVDPFEAESGVPSAGHFKSLLAKCTVSPPEATSEPSPGGADVLSQIDKLGDLRDRGVVTEAEFEAKKADLLGRL